MRAASARQNQHIAAKVSRRERADTALTRSLDSARCERCERCERGGEGGGDSHPAATRGRTWRPLRDTADAAAPPGARTAARPARPARPPPHACAPPAPERSHEPPIFTSAPLTLKFNFRLGGFRAPEWVPDRFRSRVWVPECGFFTSFLLSVGSVAASNYFR